MSSCFKKVSTVINHRKGKKKCIENHKCYWFESPNKHTDACQWNIFLLYIVNLT